MNTNHNKLFFIPLLALGLGLTACNDDEDNDVDPAPGPTQNIVQIASGNPDFSILADALTQAGLISTLQGSGPFTVFAPDNVAFNTFFDNNEILDTDSDGSRVDELILALGAEAVQQTLLYHVLGGEVRAADVPLKGYVTTSSTLSPGNEQLSLLAEARSTGVILNNTADVTAADILATNGVIHRINAVLTLPDITDHAINNPADLSALVNAVVLTGLLPTLSNPDATFTLFAPTNAAFALAPAGLTNQQLSTVLTYHVLDTQVRSEDITSGSVNTVAGQAFTITASAEGVTILDTAGNLVNVILTNIQGTNGVVHLIDGVLIPVL